MTEAISTPLTVRRRRQIEAQTGYSRSTLYKRITDGLWPKPVAIGPRAVGWPAAEADAITAAVIAGQSEDELRDLVRRLEASRKHAASGSRRAVAEHAEVA